MRMYDIITQKRFDMNHPAWIEGMKNKNGSVSKRWDAKKAKLLTDAGIVKLVPSVTEVAKVADGFGAFNVGSIWGRDMALEALQWHIENGLAVEFEAVKNLCKANMDAPRNEGSELHDLFHRVESGEIAPDQDEKTWSFYRTCQDALESMGYKEGKYHTEVEFANNHFGGTCDLDGDLGMVAFGVDWKTVKDWRKPRNSELLQVGAYAHHFGWEKAHIVYIKQESKFPYQTLSFGGSQLAGFYHAFCRALDLYSSIQTLGVSEE